MATPPRLAAAPGLTEVLSALQHMVVALNNQVQTWKQALPGLVSGTPATSATAGSASALPATPAGYLIMTNPATGQPIKVPFYNP